MTDHDFPHRAELVAAATAVADAHRGSAGSAMFRRFAVLLEGTTSHPRGAEPCANCEGTGKVAASRMLGAEYAVDECPNCAGTGRCEAPDIAAADGATVASHRVQSARLATKEEGTT